MKKKVLAVLLTGLLAAGVLSACGNGTQQEAEAPAAEGSEAVEQKGTITIAASATPHAEILEKAKPILAEQGWNLEITVFDDYVQPNLVVDGGDMDANYFQHIPYLDEFNAERGTALVNAGGIHYEPFGIYPGTKKSLDEVAEGDKSQYPTIPRMKRERSCYYRITI